MISNHFGVDHTQHISAQLPIAAPPVIGVYQVSSVRIWKQVNIAHGSVPKRSCASAWSWKLGTHANHRPLENTAILVKALV